MKDWIKPCFFFGYLLHALLQNPRCGCGEYGYTYTVLRPHFVFILLIFVGYAAGVQSRAAVLQRAEADAFSYVIASRALYAHQRFVPGEGKSIHAPVICFYIDAPCAL